ncbi:MAG TPA: YggT family protein [Anaerolineaceae bacterium]|nr:YggT family protein [Anaerolineaceae bacterium]
MGLLLNIVHSIGQVFSILVLASVLLSYFLPASNPIRLFVDRIVNPMLTPIRKIIKPFNGLDFSPVILMIAIYLVEWVLTQVIVAAMR